MNVLLFLAATVLFLIALNGAFWTLLLFNQLLKQPFQLLQMFVLTVLLPAALGMLCIRASRSMKN